MLVVIIPQERRPVPQEIGVASGMKQVRGDGVGAAMDPKEEVLRCVGHEMVVITQEGVVHLTLDVDKTK